MDVNVRGLAERGAQELHTDSGAPRGCTPANARRLADPTRGGLRGKGTERAGAARMFGGRLSPDKRTLWLPTPSMETERKLRGESDRGCILFYFCQSRREETTP